MKHPEFTCTSCGSANLRRSHSSSLADLWRMFRGTYPFRCLDCRSRIWIDIWLFSKGKAAVCPRCLGLEVAPATTDGMRLTLPKRMMVAAGARSYLCTTCNRRFLSFKRVESANGKAEPARNARAADAVSAASAGK